MNFLAYQEDEEMQNYNIFNWLNLVTEQGIWLRYKNGDLSRQ